jgi:hypothetical protein
VTQDEVIKMARQAGDTLNKEWLQRFANLVADKATEEANANKNASWTLMCKKMVAFEREACAKVVDDIEARCIAKDVDDPPLKHVAAAIRARGEQA